VKKWGFFLHIWGGGSGSAHSVPKVSALPGLAAENEVETAPPLERTKCNVHTPDEKAQRD
jgi:hypothetical protein